MQANIRPQAGMPGATQTFVRLRELGSLQRAGFIYVAVTLAVRHFGKIWMHSTKSVYFRFKASGVSKGNASQK